MGTKLAAALKRAISEMESEDKPRAQIVAGMGRSAGIDAGTVNQILEGSIDCPPVGRLRGMARALDISVEALTRAASQDGCEY